MASLTSRPSMTSPATARVIGARTSFDLDHRSTAPTVCSSTQAATRRIKNDRLDRTDDRRALVRPVAQGRQSGQHLLGNTSFPGHPWVMVGEESWGIDGRLEAQAVV